LIEFMEQTPQFARIGNIEDLRGLALPKALQPIADSWTRNSATQPAGGAR
jgi:hypothetical protein